jgi:hypothetical protein
MADFRILSRVGYAEPEVFSLPPSTDGAFVPVYFQPQFLLDKSADTFHHSISHPLASDKDEIENHPVQYGRYPEQPDTARFGESLSGAAA